MVIKKKGYFFLLDAMLGLSVIVIGTFLILSLFIKVPEQTQVGLIADDLMNYLSNTKIKDLNNPYAGIGGELWRQGLITDPENSLLQQTGEFYAKSNLDTAEKFIQNVSKEVLPSQFMYEIWIDNKKIYPKISSLEHIKSKDTTDLLLTSKKITFDIINTTTNDLWGPYKAEVFAWNVGKTTTGTATSYSICKNAEDSGSCNGLDAVHGAGYKCLCCNEHNFCCAGC